MLRQRCCAAAGVPDIQSTKGGTDMTYDEIIETLRTYATETFGDCPKDCPA